MKEIRFAKKSDIPKLKEIWKICFGDDDDYIDFFFKNKYKEEETLLSLCDAEIAAMLTMIPTKIVMPDNSSLKASMIYAVATHPKYRGKGLSSKLMEYSNNYLLNNNVDASILVPATESLFKFYSRQGYMEGFYLREVVLTDENIKGFERITNTQCLIVSATPEEYNKRRENLLQGKLYVAYGDEEIAYQKALSKYSGADIYAIDIEDIRGCAIVERINSEKVIIKELLIPEKFLKDGIIQITKLLPAKEYILRLPSYLGEDFGGVIRAFGMIHLHRRIDEKVVTNTSGYMGLAYD